MLLENKLELFKEELSLIDNEYVYEIVEHIIDKTPDYYFLQPASTSGLYHPVDEITTGGKIRHHRKCFKLAEQTIRRYGINTEKPETLTDNDKLSLNILRAMAIIHDMPHCYYWSDEKQRYRTDINHSFKNAEELYFHVRDYDSLFDIDQTSQNDLLMVACIFYHMGCFVPVPEEYKWLDEKLSIFKDHFLVKCTQEIDYYSSRRMISIELNDNK